MFSSYLRYGGVEMYIQVGHILLGFVIWIVAFAAVTWRLVREKRRWRDMTAAVNEGGAPSLRTLLDEKKGPKRLDALARDVLDVVERRGEPGSTRRAVVALIHQTFPGPSTGAVLGVLLFTVTFVLLPVLIGAFIHEMDIVQTVSSLDMASPERRTAYMEDGIRLAASPLDFGWMASLCFVVPAFVLAVAWLRLGSSNRRRWAALEVFEALAPIPPTMPGSRMGWVVSFAALASAVGVAFLAFWLHAMVNEPYVPTGFGASELANRLHQDYHRLRIPRSSAWADPSERGEGARDLLIVAEAETPLRTIMEVVFTADQVAACTMGLVVLDRTGRTIKMAPFQLLAAGRGGGRASFLCEAGTPNNTVLSIDFHSISVEGDRIVDLRDQFVDPRDKPDGAAGIVIGPLRSVLAEIEAQSRPEDGVEPRYARLLLGEPASGPVVTLTRLGYHLGWMEGRCNAPPSTLLGRIPMRGGRFDLERLRANLTAIRRATPGCETLIVRSEPQLSRARMEDLLGVMELAMGESPQSQLYPVIAFDAMHQPF